LTGFSDMNTRGGANPVSSKVLGILVPMVLCFPAPVLAVSPLTLSGALAGTVRSVVGKPQMGATVFLYDHRDKLLARILTNDEGTFSFAGLIPDLYSVRVTLPSFLPAMRDRIQIDAGMRRLLDVNLSTLFSSVQFAPPSGASPVLMNDDWKWVLRTSSSTRPVLRILPGTLSTLSHGPVFSDTRGLVKVTAGDPGSGAAFSEQADMGTAFAFSTSLYGSNQLQFTGNVGYASGSGLPSAAFQTTFSRPLLGGNPEISVSMRQLSMPDRAGFLGAPGSDGSVPRLRTMSVSIGEKARISDSLDLEYGMEMDSVSYVNRVHYLSPYARLTFHADGSTTVDFTYTSGNARPDLGTAPGPEQDSLDRDVAALSRVPRLSMRNGSDHVQRGENYELGVSRRQGSREYRVAAYRESVRDAALTVSGSGDAFSGDVLPDLFSNTAVFDAGDYHTIGYTASVTQNLADDRYKITVICGSVGVLVPDNSAPVANNAEALRALIHAAHRDVLTTQASGTAPVTGTHFLASYQWANAGSATPGHLYSTDPAHPEPGFNVYIRQPVPSAFGLPARVELTGDFRNLLAQGYLPFSLTDGRRFLLTRTPRSFRGGLSFTF
jgi:hypothetical protein